jgi:predicted nucleic acid-binding protein
MIQSHALSLIWSFILDYENSLNPYEDVRMEIEMLSPFASEHIYASEEIRLTSKRFEQKGVKPRDALHIACALKGNADFFITCDDNIVKKCNHIYININIINPIDFIRKVEVIRNGNTK